MANKIRAGFIDNSDNEDGFKINVGTGIGAEVTHDLPRNRNLIDGGTSVTLGAASNGVKSFIEIISDGTNYHIITSGGSVTVS